MGLLSGLNVDVEQKPKGTGSGNMQQNRKAERLHGDTFILLKPLNGNNPRECKNRSTYIGQQLRDVEERLASDRLRK